VESGRLPCVTREEIAVTGRILQSIDLSNQIVASVSQWLLDLEKCQGTFISDRCFSN
jgi:hypothetical protein